MATSEGLPDGPPTKKAKIGGDANGEHYIFSFYLCQQTFTKRHKAAQHERHWCSDHSLRGQCRIQRHLHCFGFHSREQTQPATQAILCFLKSSFFLQVRVNQFKFRLKFCVCFNVILCQINWQAYFQASASLLGFCKSSPI